jgi:hypothetical protein
MKDPAFLFYSSDFLTGVTDLTMEERGQYITLLCVQHQKGHLPEKTIRLSVGLCSVDVMAKFEQDENGLYFNQVLDEKIEQRRKFTESKRLNGLRGGRPKSETKPKQNLNKTDSLFLAKPIANLTENENEDVNKDKEEFEYFWNQYHLKTGKPKSDKEPALKKWSRLTKTEKRMAIEKIPEYAKTNVPDFLKKARTYLEDKAFNDEMKPYEPHKNGYQREEQKPPIKLDI